MEIISNDPKEALLWYEKKLDEATILNQRLAKHGYEPLGGMVSLMFNYSKNIRHLKKRIKEAQG